MAVFIIIAAVRAKEELAKQGIDIKHSVVLEVLAGLLGYQTFDALDDEELDQSLERHLGDAQFLILNNELGVQRSTQLCESAPAVLTECIAALVRSVPILVFLSVEEYFSCLGWLAVQAMLHDCSNESGAKRKVKPPTDAGAFRVATPVWSATASWTLDAYITEKPNDAMDPAQCHSIVTLEFQKAGRAGLVLRLDGCTWKAHALSRTVLECSNPDVLVERSDGSVCTPIVGVLSDQDTRLILGFAASATEREARVDAVRDASDHLLARQRRRSTNAGQIPRRSN